MHSPDAANTAVYVAGQEPQSLMARRHDDSPDTPTRSTRCVTPAQHNNNAGNNPFAHYSVLASTARNVAQRAGTTTGVRRQAGILAAAGTTAAADAATGIAAATAATALNRPPGTPMSHILTFPLAGAFLNQAPGPFSPPTADAHARHAAMHGLHVGGGHPMTSMSAHASMHMHTGGGVADEGAGMQLATTPRASGLGLLPPLFKPDATPLTAGECVRREEGATCM